MDLILNNSSEEILSEAMRTNMLTHLVNNFVDNLESFLKVLLFFNNETAS